MRPLNEVPIKITAVVKRDSKITQQQLALILVPLVVYVIFIIVMINKINSMEDQNSIAGAWTLIVIISLITLRVIMRWGFDEKKLYQEYIKEKTMDIKRYWGIMDINDNGCILYTNGCTAYVLKMERSNKIGREDSFEEQHFIAVSTAIRQFMTAGYLIKKYSLATTDDNSESFSWLDKNRLTLSNKMLKSIVGDIIKYSKSLSTGSHNRYVEYWLVYAKEPKKQQLDETIKIVNDMRITIYKPQVLNSDGVYKFISDFYKLRFINFGSCFYHNVPDEQVLRVIKDSIRYKHEAKGTFEPIDARAELAVQKYKDQMQMLDNNSTLE